MKHLLQMPSASAVNPLRRVVLALPLLGALPSWAARSPVASPLVRKSIALMGTRVTVAVAPADAVERGNAEGAIHAALVHMQQLERLMSRYQPGSDVSRIGAAAGMTPVRISPEVLQVLRHAQHMHAASDGAFDITIGALRGWNFTQGSEHVPTHDAIKREIALVNMRDLLLDEYAQTAYLRRRGMALDLGGIAKLPILEAGLKTLAQYGISNALINGGGDVLITGMNDGKPWRVGVRDPNEPQQLLGVIEMKDKGVVASSGDYERSFVRNGRRWHHVLDPHTGWPTSGVHGITLHAERVADVNGWGTALMVRGRKAVEGFTSEHSMVDVMAGLSDSTHWMSSGMRSRLAQV